MTKVLVVEDDDIDMKLVFEILNAKGFTVQGARDGLEAISMTEKEFTT